MYTLFKLVRLISVKEELTQVKISTYAWRQHGESSLLALSCSNGFIVLWYRGSNQGPVTKQLPWPSDHPITSMCIDPTVSWLLVQTDNGNIFIIPALPMLDPQSQVNQLWCIDDVTIITAVKPKGAPTVTRWWQTLDGQQVAIIGTKLGEIIFLNLLTRQVVTETSVDVHITNMELVQDDQQTSTQLLITGKSGQQWKMLLEKFGAKVQAPDTEVTDLGYETIDGMNLPIKSVLIKPSSELEEETVFYPQDISKFSRSVTLSPQYAKGRHFVTAHCDKTSTYQVYDSSMEHNPMFFYGLPVGSFSVILTDRIIFAASKLAGDQKLLILSNQRAETSEDSDQGFNKDAVLQQFELPSEDRLLAILPKSFPFYWHEKLEEQIGKLSQDHDDNRSIGSEADQTTSGDLTKPPSPYEIPISSHTVLDGCIVISDTTVYECRPRISPERLFLELGISKSDAVFAEQLGISLSLDLNFLFEVAADFLLSHGNSKQAARLFHMSKGSPIKRVSSFSKYGYISEILPYLQQLLTKCSDTLTQAERTQLSDLALRGLVYRLRQDKHNEEHRDMLKDFLLTNIDYDEKAALILLVELGVDDLLMDFAMCKGLVLDALEVMADLRQYRLDTGTFNILVDKGYAAHIGNVASGVFLHCLDISSLVTLFCAKPQLVIQYPDLLLDNLSSLELGALLRLAEVFDPSRPLVRGYIQRKLNVRGRSSSLTSIASTWESLESSQRKDAKTQEASTMVHCFLMVVLHLNQRRQQDGNQQQIDFLFTSPAEMLQNMAESNQQNRPRLMCKPSPLGAGQAHTAIVKNGDLYTWGRLANGRLGQGECPSSQTISGPCSVASFKMLQIPVVSVACGLEHSLALTQQGVYGWGCSKYGQVGLGTRHTYTRPMVLEGLSRVTCVAVECGQYHSLALTEDAQVYSWGWAIHGQLGHCDVEERLVPDLVTYLENQSIVKVAGGYCHSLFLNSQGELYVCGSGYFGQLGLGTTIKHTTPTKIDAITDKVVTMDTNFFHNLALTSNNKVYQWGSHPHGLRHFVHQQRKARQAGQALFVQADEHLRPKLVDTSNVHGRIKQVVCGSLHCCILTKNGDVYTWGKNLDGQLGNGTRQDGRIPQMVTHINDRQVAHLVSGGEFNVAMDTTGQHWVWGRNEHGQLGMQNAAIQASIKINKPLGGKAALGGHGLDPVIPVALTLQPTSPSKRSTAMYERSLSYEDEDEEDYDSSVRVPNLDTLGDNQYGALVVPVLLECIPSLCDCYQLLRRAIDLQDWCVATVIHLHLQNYTQAMAYHLMTLRASKHHLDTNTMLTTSIQIFDHYYDYLIKMRPPPSQKEEHVKQTIYQILYHWEIENLDVTALEECLDKVLEDTAIQLAAVLFRKRTKAETSDVVEKPALFLPTQDFTSSFSAQFCQKVTSVVLQKLQGNLHKTHPSALSLLQQLGGEHLCELSSSISVVDKLPYDRLWQDIVQNLQKGLQSKQYIRVVHHELDRLENHYGDEEQNQRHKNKAVFFSCGHHFNQSLFGQEVDKFSRDLRSGLVKPEIATVLTQYYKRQGEKPMACPRCVLSAINTL